MSARYVPQDGRRHTPRLGDSWSQDNGPPARMANSSLTRLPALASNFVAITFVISWTPQERKLQYLAHALRDRLVHT